MDAYDEEKLCAKFGGSSIKIANFIKVAKNLPVAAKAKIDGP